MKGLAVLFALCLATVTAQQKCYNCAYTDNSDKLNYECVTSPADYAGGPVDQLCTDETMGCVVSSETYTNTGAIRHLTRQCADATHKEGCTTDSTGTFRTCIDICKDGALCNDDSHEPPTVDPSVTESTTSTSTSTSTIEGDTIECYSCVYSYNPGADDSCVTDPSSQRIIACPVSKSVSKKCFVKNQFDKSGNAVRSFARGCETYSDSAQGCTDSDHRTDCLTTCKTNRCNVGDGTDYVPPPSEAWTIRALTWVMSLALLLAMIV